MNISRSLLSTNLKPIIHACMIRLGSASVRDIRANLRIFYPNLSAIPQRIRYYLGLLARDGVVTAERSASNRVTYSLTRRGSR